MTNFRWATLSVATSATAVVTAAIAVATITGGLYYCDPGHEPTDVRIANVALLVALVPAVLAVIAAIDSSLLQRRLLLAVAVVELAATMAIFLYLGHQTRNYSWGPNGCIGG